MSTELYTILIWGVTFGESTGKPWESSSDNIPTEPWKERLERRLTLLDAKNPRCMIGQYGDTDTPKYYAAITESALSGRHEQAMPVELDTPGPDWEKRLKAFFTIMDIPWRTPHWNLVTYKTS